MKRLLAALLLLPVCAAAHEVAIRPVKVRLKVDPGVLRVTVEAGALAWRLSGLPVPDGTGPWSEELRRQCLSALEEGLSLSVDGRLLKGRVLGGRVSRPLWKNDLENLLSIRAVYDLPDGGKTLSGRAAIFRDHWEEVEGAGHKAPEGLPRDFRTFIRWGLSPRSLSRVTIQEPDFSIPLSRARRPAASRWFESAGLGVLALLGLGGAVVLAGAAMLFPPSPAAIKGGVAAAAAAGAVGAVLWGGTPPPVTEALLWGAAAITALAGSSRWPDLLWPGAITVGVFCGASLWAAAGVRLQDAFGFASFSWTAFVLGGVLFLSGAVLGRRLVRSAYRRYFRFLTPDELERQGLFHRKIAARLAAIAALYWILSPFWRKP